MNQAKASINNRKVAIIGVGYVGASIAYALSIRDIAREIVLIDTNFDKANGEAYDIKHGISHMGTAKVYAGNYDECSDAELIIITAGRNRVNGESRRNLMADNALIMKSIIDEIKPFYSEQVVMIVTNPVDFLTHKVSQWLNISNGKVFGTGCILDTSRFIRVVADYINISTEDLNGFVVGEHGDCQIPIWSRLSVAGVPIEEYCENVGLEWNESKMLDIAYEVKNMGSKIIRDKKRTHYGIATCVCSLTDAILNKKQIIASVSAPLNGEYGIAGVSMSVGSIIGAKGVEKRLVEHWSDTELNQFKQCAEKLKEYLKAVEG